MIIYAKIGTLAAKHVKVIRKHKPPVVGDFFEVHEHLDAKGWHGNYKPSGVRCTEIRSVGGELLYVCERF